MALFQSTFHLGYATLACNPPIKISIKNIFQNTLRNKKKEYYSLENKNDKLLFFHDKWLTSLFLYFTILYGSKRINLCVFTQIL